MKTKDTLDLERCIWKATNKQGVFGCFEVTIGWFGDERVDYMTYDTKGIFRCYEVKVTKSDFYSSAKKTFVGHFNYFVMTRELYDQVKEDIPAHIGVYIKSACVKRAKRQELQINEQVLKDSIIRSLSRDVDKLYKIHDPDYTNRMNRIINSERKEKEEYRTKFWNLQHRIWEKYGTRWDKDPSEAAADQ